jgi:hypothetical protein
MEKAKVEVYMRAANSYCLVVEPRTAIEGLRRHFETRKQEVEINTEPIIGDIGLNILSTQTIEEVLRAVAIVTYIDEN